MSANYSLHQNQLEEMAVSLAGLRGETCDPVTISMETGRLCGVLDRLEASAAGGNPVRVFSSPARTEIGGNDTDHQRGCVLCAAVGLDILAVVRATHTEKVVLSSEGMGPPDQVDLRITEPQQDEAGHSAALIRGVAVWFIQHGYRVGGFEAATTSRIPRGAGLSSSAAFELLVARIFNNLYNDGRITPTELARAGQFAENRYFGKPCGLMDQMACALGGVQLIDFKDPECPAAEPVEGSKVLDELTIAVTNTGGSHADLTEAYASIPNDMAGVAQAMGGTVLAEIDPAAFDANFTSLAETLSDRALLRALHFFGETRRARTLAEALRSGGISSFLEQVTASGHSSWMLLQNVWHPDAHTPQRLALGLATAGSLLERQGAVRVHGGGFAGTFQAFLPPPLLPAYTARMDTLFGPGSTHVLHPRTSGACEVHPV